MRKLHYLAVTALAMTVALPTLASAHMNLGVKDNENDDIKVGSMMERKFDDHSAGFGDLFNFQAGTITAVGTDNFTMTTRGGATIVVNTINAKIIRLYKTVINLADIHVNDRVWVQGDKSLNQINALVIYDLEANVKPAALKGTVTAVTGSSFTITTKHNGTVTVNTDNNTTFKQNGQPASSSAVLVGSKITARGLWNTILNILTAIKVRIS